MPVADNAGYQTNLAATQPADQKLLRSKSSVPKNSEVRKVKLAQIRNRKIKRQ